MRTVFIGGNDTGVGKTHVAGRLARVLARGGARVQVVKPVETGRQADEPGDAEEAARVGGAGVEGITLFRYSRPLAPLEAARLEGRSLALADILGAVAALAPCDWRLVEGAGGLAVPVDVDGSDWADVARGCGAESLVLVVEDRLGSINQARLLESHCRVRGLARPVFFLNAPRAPAPDVARSNRLGLARLGLACVATGSAEDLAAVLGAGGAP